MVESEFESQWGHSAPRDGDGSDEGGDGGYDDEHAMKMFRQSAYCIDLATHMPPPRTPPVQTGVTPANSRTSRRNYSRT